MTNEIMTGEYKHWAIARRAVLHYGRSVNAITLAPIYFPHIFRETKIFILLPVRRNRMRAVFVDNALNTRGYFNLNSER